MAVFTKEDLHKSIRRMANGTTFPSKNNGEVFKDELHILVDDLPEMDNKDTLRILNLMYAAYQLGRKSMK